MFKLKFKFNLFFKLSNCMKKNFVYSWLFENIIRKAHFFHQLKTSKEVLWMLYLKQFNYNLLREEKNKGFVSIENMLEQLKNCQIAIFQHVRTIKNILALIICLKMMIFKLTLIIYHVQNSIIPLRNIVYSCRII